MTVLKRTISTWAGSSDDTHNVYDLFNGDWPAKKCSGNMDSNLNVFYSAAGLPALISTGITFIYFFLKACRYVFHAISHQTKGRVAMAHQMWSTRAQHRYRKRRPHGSLRTNTGTFFRTIWQRDPKILRVHFSTKKEARPMPPFPWRCCRTYRRVHFLRKCKRTVRQKASKSPRH